MSRCYTDDCKWRKQEPNCVVCGSPNAIYYNKLTEPCSFCKRNPEEEKGGCGNCMGRGSYVYPVIFENCDCGDYERKKEVANA